MININWRRIVAAGLLRRRLQKRMRHIHFQLLRFIALLIVVNGSDIIWRPQTRFTSSLRLPCSQQHFPCRIYDVKFCSSQSKSYFGAAAWNDAAHVWRFSACPLQQNESAFEMYASSASRQEVRALMSTFCLCFSQRFGRKAVCISCIQWHGGKGDM